MGRPQDRVLRSAQPHRRPRGAARSPNPVNHDETIGELLADFALHTAHHFGQTSWCANHPRLAPPGGGDTW